MIYLDNNATTCVDPEVLEAMLPFLTKDYGNPSSNHVMGKVAKDAVEKSRSLVAQLVNCKPQEIIFTSCATESNNMIIKGIANQYANKGRHIITSKTEHPSVLEVCQCLEKQGFSITYLPVDESGLTDPQQVKNALRPDTILISIMHANNEVGTIQPITEIASIAKSAGIFLHSDTAQSLGKIPVDIQDLGVDFLTIAGHKIYAPKGIGAIYIREGIQIEKLIHGSSQENGKRAGTQSAFMSVALGKACEIAKRDMPKYIPKMQQLRDLLYENLVKNIPNIVLNGHPQKRLTNTANISFQGVVATEMLASVSDFAASVGAACNKTGYSHVLSSMNASADRVRGAVRFSVGKFNSEQDILQAVDKLTNAFERAKNNKTGCC